MSSEYDVLFSKARSGDIDAFDKLTRAYHKKVFNMTLRFCSDRVLASNLAHEIFVQAYKAIYLDKCELSVPLLVFRLTAEVCSKGTHTSCMTNLLEQTSKENL